MKSGTAKYKTVPALFFVGVLACSFWLNAQAQGVPQYFDWIRKANYKMFVGDVNSDTYPDILARATPKIVPIPLDDLTIPIVLPGSPTFVLLSSSGGPYTLTVNPSASIRNNPAWQTAAYSLFFGDILGDGRGGMLIRSNNAGVASFTIATSAGSGQPGLVQQISATDLGVDLGGPGRAVEFSDSNDDGRADLVVRTDGKISDVFIANSEGVFVRATDAAGSILAAWNAFRASLKANDIPSALEYFTSDARPDYQTALQNLSSTLSSIPQNWQPIQAVTVNDQYAIYLLDQNFEGATRSHLIVFERQSGRWVMSEF